LCLKDKENFSGSSDLKIAIVSLKLVDRLDEARELFNSLMEKDSRIHMELGDDSNFQVCSEGRGNNLVPA
jgi:hypothetical protein